LAPFDDLWLVFLILETIILIVLLAGWVLGSRRMDIILHHRAVYLIAALHLFNVSFWMIPRALVFASFVFSDPIGNWYLILHDVVGLLAVGFGALLVFLFLAVRGMPLRLLRRTRPIMFMTMILWVIAFLLGLTMVV
jgi:hypothetical protein